MKNKFAIYEIALELKELGFDEECFGYYTEQHDGSYFLCVYQEEEEFSKIRIEAPLWQQVIDWFREVHDIHIAVLPHTNPEKGITKVMYETLVGGEHNNYDPAFYNLIDRFEHIRENKPNYSLHLYDTYSEARNVTIFKAIELIKQLKNNVL